MSLKLRISFVLIFIIASAFGQEKKLKGLVLNSETKKPLVNVAVSNEKKTKFSLTDSNGEFELAVNLNEKIIFDHLGYRTYVYKVINTKNVTIHLKQNNETLDEVIITAKKNINDIDLRRATGVVTDIKVNMIKERPSVNLIETLQGKVAGLTIKSDGELGKPLKIRIRGTSTLPIKSKVKGLKDEDRQLIDNRANQPLFVLDGQIISADAFATLNVNDIQEIKVLKDATANALYGIKASNGVVEITSKRGINGETEYSFSMQQGVTFKGKPSEIMMKTKEKLAFERLSKNRKAPGYKFSEENIRIENPKAINIESLVAEGKRKLDSIRKIETNWFDELARISTYSSYNISARGGSKTNKFYASGNFTTQGGKFDGNTINRFTGRLNYEYQLSKKVYVMLNSGFGFSESDTPHSSDYSPANLMYRLNPYEQKEKGVLYSYPELTFKNLVNQYSKNQTDNRFNFSANITATLAKNLHISSIVGIDYLANESLAIIPPTAYSEAYGKTKKPVEERGKATKNKTISKSFTANTRINYSKEIDKHKISLSANTDYYKNSRDFIGIMGYGLPSKLLSGAGINNDLKGSKSSVTSSSKTTDAVLGYGFSALYTWNNKIDAYGSYKRDGSSLLPEDKRWNTFWATGLGYRISNEPFLQDSNWLSNLKLRASYGVTASLSGITASLVVPTFTYGKKGYLGTREFYLKDLFNKGLRPEKNTSINLGFDLGLFNKINLSVEAYHRRTTDLLLTVPVAPSNGFTQQLKNVGVMDNQGIEFTLNATPIKADNFRWSTSANLAYNKNKVIDLYEGTTLTLSDQQPYPDYAEGQPANLLYGLVSLGIDSGTGTPIFRRKDGSILNGITTNPTFDDFIILGYSTPPYNGGWYNSFSYKEWQLSFDLYYSFGGKAIYPNRAKTYDANDTHKNLPAGQFEKTWFNPGDDGKIFKSLFLNGNNYYNTVENYADTGKTGNTNFVRLNNIMLRYSFNDSYLKKIGGSFIKDFAMYAQLKNIATWSSFGNVDSESANLKGSAQPIFTIGANITF